MVAAIPPWQIEFRVYGRPSAGTGAVMQGIIKSGLLYPEMPKPPTHWKRLIACDIGYKDDFIIMCGAVDPDTGEVWVYEELAFTGTDAVVIAAAVKARQHGYIPLLMPQDAKFERGLGVTFKTIFQNAGCIVCEELAANWLLDPTGKNKSIGSGVKHMRDLMVKGLFKVVPTAATFLKEFDLYSYDDKGKFKQGNDHAMDTARYLTQGINKLGISEYEHLHKPQNQYSQALKDAWEEAGTANL